MRRKKLLLAGLLAGMAALFVFAFCWLRGPREHVEWPKPTHNRLRALLPAGILRACYEFQRLSGQPRYSEALVVAEGFSREAPDYPGDFRFATPRYACAMPEIVELLGDPDRYILGRAGVSGEELDLAMYECGRDPWDGRPVDLILFYVPSTGVLRYITLGQLRPRSHL